MADESEAGASAVELTGFEGYSSKTLLKILSNLNRGKDQVVKHYNAGTWEDRPKDGSATPREAGYTFVMLSDGIEHVLKERDPDWRDRDVADS